MFSTIGNLNENASEDKKVANIAVDDIQASGKAVEYLIEQGDYYNPRLTTVPQPVEEMERVMIEHLFEMIEENADLLRVPDTGMGSESRETFR